MFENEDEGMMPQSGTSLNELLKKEMADTITKRLMTDKAYQHYLLNTSGLYQRTLNVIGDAIAVYEESEAYENCKFLLGMKKEILKRNEDGII